MKFLKAVCIILLVFAAIHLNAQFHSLTLPMLSPKASVSQQLGSTFIKIDYNSPSIRGRDVWNNPNVIPQNGKPFPWRAGAQGNTTIQFDTDVLIEGKPIPAGKYGFHIIPDGHEHTLLFAKPNNLWGSYYLEIERDVLLQMKVKDTANQFFEHLSYHFNKRTDSSVAVNLSWGDRTIPFTVSVDLNKTTLKKLRIDLQGESTYQWEAWNDAAAWCLERNTNLEEALAWVNRSINGGLGGFAANKNYKNLGTKIELLKALNKPKEMNLTIEEAMKLEYSIDDAHIFSGLLIEINEEEKAVDFLRKALVKYKDEWGIQYMLALAYYFDNKLPKAKSYLKKCKSNSPKLFFNRVEITMQEMENHTYTYPKRNN